MHHMMQFYIAHTDIFGHTPMFKVERDRLNKYSKVHYDDEQSIWP